MSDIIKVKLSDREPILLKRDEWDLIAETDDFDHKIEFQATKKWKIRIRKHKDGRKVVYGTMRTLLKNENNNYSGFLLKKEEDIIPFIKQCVEDLGASNKSIDNLISNLSKE